MFTTETIKIVDNEFLNSENYHYEQVYKCLNSGKTALSPEELKGD